MCDLGLNLAWKYFIFLLLFFFLIKTFGNIFSLAETWTAKKSSDAEINSVLCKSQLSYCYLGSAVGVLTSHDDDLGLNPSSSSPGTDFCVTHSTCLQ